MSNFYPVKLIPAFKDYIWGGERLKKEFNKKCDFEKVAESWELSAHKDGESRVAFEGEELTLSAYVARLGKSALGKNSGKYDYFPLLIKLIDDKQALSVQVHPSDEYALEHEGEYGKTEMWYVVDCDEGASLYYGFKSAVTREEYAKAITEDRLCELLRKVEVKAGDVFFIPSGTVHAIGAGMLICEVQQNSNTTYRVYDYGRRDSLGNLRPLHIDKALQVSNLEPMPEIENVGDMLCACEYFEVYRRSVSGKSEIAVSEDSFASLTVTRGECKLIFDGGEIELCTGESVFIPAQNKSFEILGECEIIDSRVK